jgi:hypothetical protein
VPPQQHLTVAAAWPCLPLPQITAEVRPIMRQYTIYPKFVDNPGIENSKWSREL